MIAEKSSDVKVQRVSGLAESKSRCCISHDFGGFYQIIPCIRPALFELRALTAAQRQLEFSFWARGASVAEGAQRATNAARYGRKMGKIYHTGKG